MDLTEAILSRIGTLPEVSHWPQLVEIVRRGRSMDWHIPVLVAEAFGRCGSNALSAAAALACLQVSIILVDDMLDNDPRGGYREHGEGRTANIAMALQASGARLIAEADLPAEASAAAQTEYAQIALKTAYGQQIDSENLRGEANYWRVVDAKSTPFYAGALKLGALFALAPADQTRRCYDLGYHLGELVQIADDIEDALNPKINADWGEERNNLLIMYAEFAEHPDRDLFRKLRSDIHAPRAHAQAQEILIASGALSYALFVAAQKYAKAEQLLERMQLPNREPLLKHLLLYRDAFYPYVSLVGLDSIQELL